MRTVGLIKPKSAPKAAEKPKDNKPPKGKSAPKAAEKPKDNKPPKGKSAPKAAEGGENE